MGVVVPDKPQKIKILNHGWYDCVHVAGRGYAKVNSGKNREIQLNQETIICQVLA